MWRVQKKISQSFRDTKEGLEKAVSSIENLSFIEEVEGDYE